MPFKPEELGLKLEVEGDVAKPEVRIFFILEPLFLPRPRPAFFDGIDYVFAVRIDLNRKFGGLDFLERTDYCQEFHAVVGSQSEAFS